MKISKIVTILLLCLLIVACGDSKRNKREPANRSKRNTEILEKRKAEKQEREKKLEEAKEAQKEKFQRNNGNYRKSSQRQQEKMKRRRKKEIEPTVVPEEDPEIAKAARIEKRVKLELDIRKANKEGNTSLADKLKEEAEKIEKEMRQPELDEVYKKLKDIKKRM